MTLVTQTLIIMMTPIYCYQWCLAHIHFIRVSPQKLRCTCLHVRLLFLLVPNIYIYIYKVSAYFCVITALIVFEGTHVTPSSSSEVLLFFYMTCGSILVSLCHEMRTESERGKNGLQMLRTSRHATHQPHAFFF